MTALRQNHNSAVRGKKLRFRGENSETSVNVFFQDTELPKFTGDVQGKPVK